MTTTTRPIIHDEAHDYLTRRCELRAGLNSRHLTVDQQLAITEWIPTAPKPLIEQETWIVLGLVAVVPVGWCIAEVLIAVADLVVAAVMP